MRCVFGKVCPHSQRLAFGVMAVDVESSRSFVADRGEKGDWVMVATGVDRTIFLTHYSSHSIIEVGGMAKPGCLPRLLDTYLLLINVIIITIYGNRPLTSSSKSDILQFKFFQINLRFFLIFSAQDRGDRQSLVSCDRKYGSHTIRIVRQDWL